MVSFTPRCETATGSARKCKQYFAIPLCLILIVYIFFPWNLGERDLNQLRSTVSGSVVETSLSALIAKYENCTISFSGRNDEKGNFDGEITTKPLWLPSYPNSVDDKIIRGIVNKITGLEQSGTRSYYSQVRNTYRHCKGKDQKIAVCTVIHPVIEMSPTPLGKTSDFDQNIIYAIRNPMTTFPAFHNSKAIKYHGHPSGEQVLENDWRKFRDEYLVGLIEQWKNQLRTWKNMTTDNNNEYYTISMYLVYEQIMNFQQETTPLTTIRYLIKVLESAGFDVDNPAIDNDIPCIWYHAVGKENFQRHDKFGYEYTDYFPGYTKDQKDLFLHEIDSFMKEYRSDDELVNVLKGYYADIRDNMKIDIPWVNNDNTDSTDRK